MFNFLGRLLGTEKAIGQTIGAVANGLDALIYTDEEMAGDAAKDRSEARKMVVEWMAATQGQNLARRLIALSITGVWLSMYLLAVMCSMVAVFTNADGVVTSEKVNQVGIIAKSGAIDMGPAVMLILAFYFAAPHMGSLANAVIGKFTNKANNRDG